ncbi:MAG: TetR/AcrR family transcriptional regulator [bacterium]
MKKNKNIHGTKNKILTAAKKLFAEKGFHGTSTREIAREAKVNLAGLHYHFQNKQNLYGEVVKSLYNDTNDMIKHIIAEKDWKTEELVIKIFKTYLDSEQNVAETYRIIIGSGKILESLSKDETMPQYGPGGYALYNCIIKEFGEGIAPQLKFWAVKAIISFIELNALRFHVVEGTTLAIEKDVLINDLRKLTDVVLDQLRI